MRQINYYPDAKWQRCGVHFYRNVFSVVVVVARPEKVDIVSRGIAGPDDADGTLLKGIARRVIELLAGKSEPIRNR